VTKKWKLIYNPNILYHSEAYICGEWEGRYGDPYRGGEYANDDKWKYRRGYSDGADFRMKRLAVYGRTPMPEPNR
jgi:hypothetical protein